MGRPPSGAGYVASLWDFRGVADKQALLGFTVRANLADGRTREAWADALGTPRTYLAEMIKAPTRPFLRKLAAELGGRPQPQRLQPDLWTFYGDLFPGSAEEDAVGWLTRYFDMMSEGRSLAAEALLRAEAAIAKCRVAGEAMSGSLSVRDELNSLCVLASGPYGGSHAATQKAVELGLLVPSSFLEVVQNHLHESPVGFRLLRVIDRMVRIVDDEEVNESRAQDTSPEIMLRQLLSGLVLENYVDFYPGGEWALSIAQRRLRKRNPLGYRYLQRIASSTGLARERAGAVWALVKGAPEGGVEGDKKTRRPEYIPRNAISVLRTASQDVGSEAMARLAELLELRREDPVSPASEEDFLPKDLVKLIEDHLHSAALAPGLAEPVASIVEAVLATPSASYRRSLIEAIPAANLVPEVVPLLIKVWDQTDDPYLQETVLFALSRLRQPDPDVTELFLKLMNHPNPFVAQSAIWGLGDTFDKRRTGAAHAAVMPERLEVIAIGRDGRCPGESTTRVRLAAAHSLAILARELQATEHLEHVIEALSAGNSQDDELILRMVRWGFRAGSSDELIDPTDDAS